MKSGLIQTVSNRKRRIAYDESCPNDRSQAPLGDARITNTEDRRRRSSGTDAFAVATARHENAVELTGNPEFGAVETVVQIEWLEE